MRRGELLILMLWCCTTLLQYKSSTLIHSPYSNAQSITHSRRTIVPSQSRASPLHGLYDDNNPLQERNRLRRDSE